MLYNPNLSSMLLGCLLSRTELLFSPKYPLSKGDFEPNKFHQIIFVSITKLAQNGCQEIDPIEVESFLKAYPVQLEVYVDNNGGEFIETVKELANLDNYDMYYDTIRKLSLLRDLQDSGVDITEWYDEADEIKAEAELNKHTIQSILNELEYSQLKLRAKYDVNFTRDEMSAGEDTEELLAGFEEAPAFGALLQSPYLSTLYQGWCKNHLLLRSAPSGVGKAIPNNTIIPTPIGDKRVDEISVGDYLYDRCGKPTKVIGVFPQGKKEVWEVVFKDGRKARCCEEHLWSYRTIGQKHTNPNKYITSTLAEIYKKHNLITNDGCFRYAVPMNEPIEKEEKKYKIDPYVFGLFLGDASFREQECNKTLSYSSSDDELPNKICAIMNWDCKKNSDFNYNWTFSKDGKKLWVRDILSECPELINTYSGEKFIPNIYMEGSIQQRLALLRGLLDTDGTIGKNGNITFVSTSQKMVAQVVELCRSLGMKPTITLDKRNEKYKSNYCATVRIACSPKIRKELFSYSPKKELNEKILQKKRHEHNDTNPIVAINNLGFKTEMTCFLVDNNEHLFLMNDYIVTHNTRLAVGDLCNVAAKELWDDEAKDFIPNLNYQGRGFYIHTEMITRTEINPMFLACISGVEYRKITNGLLEPDEKKRVLKASEILLQNPLHIIDMPDFTSASIERIIKRETESEGCSYGVFDYVQLQPALSAEFKAIMNAPPREDLILKNLVTDLKMYAEKYNVGLMSMTQLNGNEKTMDFPDESCLSGSKAMKTKIDAGSIILNAKEKPKSLKRVEPFVHKRGFKDGVQPNIVEMIYKSRYSMYASEKVKVWSYFDRGTLRRHDFFVTNANDEIMNVPKSVVEDF